MCTELDELIKLRKGDIEQASKVMGRAFQNDPIIAYAYPNENDRKSKTPYVYEFLLSYFVRYAEVYATSKYLEGIAVWQRHEYKKLNMSFWQIFISGAMWPAFKMGMNVGKRMQPFFEYIENKRWELVPYPHWYLMAIGVDPKYQGKGCASKLIKTMLTRIGKEGLPCYLETETEKNVALYQHFDFKVIEEFIVPDTELKLWAMLRESKQPKNI